MVKASFMIKINTRIERKFHQRHLLLLCLNRMGDGVFCMDISEDLRLFILKDFELSFVCIMFPVGDVVVKVIMLYISIYLNECIIKGE